jgi:hypothetical protein
MHRGHRYAVLIIVMLAAYKMLEREAWSAPGAAANAEVKVLQVLDTAARDAEERVRGRCGDAQVGVDLEAEESAHNAAHIHQERLVLARAKKFDAKVLTAVAIQAAESFQSAYQCNRVAVAHLEAAKRVLMAQRASLPEDAVHAREEIDKELAEVVALRDAHDAGAGRPTQTPVPIPRVRMVVLDAGEISLATPRSNTFMGRLALRLDLGFGRTDLELDPDPRAKHRGFYFRAQFLARFMPGQQDRIFLLFGPFYNVLSARAPIESVMSPKADDATMHSFGAHFEIQWNPRRAEPWLSFHPFLDVGLEYITAKDSKLDVSGFQGGGGALVCVVHASICPNFRIMSVPRVASKNDPTIQVGVALDVLRWVDLSLSRRRARPRASVR